MENSAANTTTPVNPPYSWVEEPKQRGSFGILSLCFSTLIICIWSALHFNIPTRRRPTFDRLFLQGRLIMSALLLPELLLFKAMNEWANASVLVKKVKQFHPDLAGPGVCARVCNWFRNDVSS